MAKVQGVEQSAAGGTFSVSPVNAPVSTARSNVGSAISRFTKTIGDIADAASKKEKDIGLGRDVASLSRQLESMKDIGANPVEIEQRRMNGLQAISRSHGISGLNKAKDFLSRKKLSQVEIGGFTALVDEGGQVRGFDGGPQSNIDALSDDVLQEVAKTSADFPEFAGTFTQVAEKIAPTGEQFDSSSIIAATQTMSTVRRSITEFPLRIKHMFNNGTTDATLLANTQNKLSSDIINSVMEGGRTIMSPEIINALQTPDSGITPADITAMYTSYFSDTMQLLRENDAFNTLGMDASATMKAFSDMQKDMRVVATELFAGRTEEAASAQALASSRFALTKLTLQQAIADGNPELFKAGVASEMIKDVATALQTRDVLEQKALLDPSLTGTLNQVDRIIFGGNTFGRTISQLDAFPVTDYDRQVVPFFQLVQTALGDPTLEFPHAWNLLAIAEKKKDQFVRAIKTRFKDEELQKRQIADLDVKIGLIRESLEQTAKAMGKSLPEVATQAKGFNDRLMRVRGTNLRSPGVTIPFPPLRRPEQ